MITFEAFKENAPDWLTTVEDARNQIIAADSDGRVGRVVLNEGEPVGWIGVIKGKYVWEIHPIAIAVKAQYGGLGHLLVEDVADIARQAGALTLLADTSDEVGTTNLFDTDLYIDPVDALKNIQALGRNPFKFWENVGFTVVGLLPDAEGPGKPAIQLARRL